MCKTIGDYIDEDLEQLKKETKYELLIEVIDYINKEADKYMKSADDLISDGNKELGYYNLEINTALENLTLDLEHKYNLNRYWDDVDEEE